MTTKPHLQKDPQVAAKTAQLRIQLKTLLFKAFCVAMALFGLISFTYGAGGILVGVVTFGLAAITALLLSIWQNTNRMLEHLHALKDGNPEAELMSVETHRMVQDLHHKMETEDLEKAWTPS